MKKLLYYSCLIFGILSEASSFAVQYKNTASRAIVSPTSSEEKCIAEINQVRQKYGLKPMRHWTQLSHCAREHSQNMATGRCTFGHDGFEKRAEQMRKQGNLLSFGENVAYSHHYSDPVKAAIDGWMKSSGHKKNILGDFNETGIGVAISSDGKFYITQLFAKR